MKKIIFFVGILLLLTGCVDNSGVKSSDIEGSDKVSEIKVLINDKEYILNLENSKTTEEFVGLLPQEFNMSDLNGNEKYIYMDISLTTNSYNPKYIEKGDVMLFGNNCLVIFYKSFATDFDYTKIGHIDNLDDLGPDNITVKFES